MKARQLLSMSCSLILSAVALPADADELLRSALQPITIPLEEFIPLSRPKPPCDEYQMQDIRQQATAENSSVKIDCSFDLNNSDVITKRLIFEGNEASGVVFDGHGALLNGNTAINAGKDMIEVKSRSVFDGTERTWEKPVHVTIKNCIVTGSIRIWGMSKNGEGESYDDNGVHVNHYKNSSFKTGHSARARTNAPAYITLDHLTITGTGRNPVYFAPGVSYSKLINSTLLGSSTHVAVYLDAESARNIIKNNEFQFESGDHAFERWDQPLIAIDGSSYNTISNNIFFSSLSHGGIYLYRNCGQGGVVRHSTPSHNQIINNIFYYNSYEGDNPAIYLSSKNDDFTLTGVGFGFCEDDEGYPFGSSESNLDFARYNVVMQNQIYKRSVDDMIVTKNPSVNYPNYVNYNTTVTIAVDRLSGCYIGSRGYQKEFIEHGQSIEALQVHPDFRSFNYSCNNGSLSKTGENGTVTRYTYDCKVSGDDNGCSKVIACPGSGNRTIIGATAAANLESGDITDEMMGLVPTNAINVLTSSDETSDGLAFIGDLNLRSGEKVINNVDGLNEVRIGCKEHDSNGGDCHIRVYLYCRSLVPATNGGGQLPTR